MNEEYIEIAADEHFTGNIIRSAMTLSDNNADDNKKEMKMITSDDYFNKLTLRRNSISGDWREKDFQFNDLSITYNEENNDRIVH